jgi:hypothetical protein
VRSLLDGRSVWIDLLGDIFSSFPPVPNGYPSDAYLKAHPRPDREMIVLDKIESVYQPDLIASLVSAPTELSLQTAVAPGQTSATISDPAIPAGSHGFIVTLSITTPHSLGFQYVLSSLIPNLQKFDQAAMTKWNTDNPNLPRNFYIAKVSAPMQRVQIKDDPTRMQLLQASYNDVQALLGIKPGDQTQQPTPTPPYNGGGYRPGGGYGPPPIRGRYSPYGAAPAYSPPAATAGAGTNSDPGVFLDRLTNEDRRDDWEMKVELVVVVDPPPPVAPTATQ